MALSLGDPQIPVLSKGYGRLKGRAVRRRNFLVATLLSDYAKTMLGPKGMYKMLMDSQGEVIVTKDGKVMMEKIEAKHPVARMLKEAAKAQDVEVGDGTKTAIILTGAFLKEADKLLERKIHPTIIIDGYGKAVTKAFEALEKTVTGVSIDDDDLLRNIAETVIGGRFDEDSKEHLSNLVVKAIKQIFDQESGNVNVDHIDCRKKAGGSLRDSELIQGLIIYKERSHPNMPKRIENAKIALVTKALEISRKTTEVAREYVIEDPKQLTAFKEAEDTFMKEIARKIRGAGTDILFCRKRISDSMMAFFAEERVLAFELTGEDDMERLAEAVGAEVISDVNDIKESDLGWAGLAEFRKVAGDEMLFLEGCRDPKALTILIRGGNIHVVDEVERVVRDAAKTISVAIKGDGIVPGGGASELEMASAIRRSLRRIGGKEQLALEAFANAVESIPEALIKNAGLDPIDFLTALRTEHVRGKKAVGINVFDNSIMDMEEVGIVEPCEVKKHALKLAYEVAESILRIDDMIAVTRRGEIEREEERKVMARERIQQEKIRRALEEEEELKDIDRSLMERMKHPETM